MIRYDIGPDVEALSTHIGDTPPADLVTPMHQAHSTRIVAVPCEASDTYGVDALVTDVPGVAVGVRTADCVPVLLYDRKRRVVAAVHSGWKGCVQNIIRHTVERMAADYTCNPADISAVIGPCIHQAAFEVGDEVYDAFVAQGYGEYAARMTNPYVKDSVEKWHIDLPGVCRHQLSQAGITDVHTCDLCTYKNHQTLYSYRYSHSLDKSFRIYSYIRML